jgi:hypothetical protein
VTLARRRSNSGLALILALAVVVAAGCALTGGTLGGREKCWSGGSPRAASLWRGILRIDGAGDRLETPEGEVIPLMAGTLAMRVGDDGTGQLVRGSDVVAKAGDDVTLFGGVGSDGVLQVCAVEEVHASS